MSSIARWRAWDPWGRGRSRGNWRVLPALIWLGFILFPLVNAATSKGSPATRALLIVGAAVFTAAYIWLVFVMFRPSAQALRRVLGATLVLVAVAMTLYSGSSWGFLFTYCAACLGLMLPSRYGVPAVLACAAVAAGCSTAGGASGGNVIGLATSTIGIGLLLVVMRDLRTRNQELSEARAELARAAVAQERERFARDLHDLLGHSLSVIAIKAELAGRLLPGETAQAAREVAEVEQVARQALGEVRQAVSGYRRPTLDGELEGARMALSAAGIQAEFERAPVELDPEVEAVLAWAVREGATNVIRHSRARHCTVTVRAGLDGAGVEVVDDGRSPGAVVAGDGNGAGLAVEGGGDDDGDNGGAGGNGIAGLAERAERVRGRLEAGRLPGGDGFRLAVSVPRPGA